MWTHTCSLPPFHSVGLVTPAFSDRLALSRRHNRQRTVRSACADKCLVSPLSCHYVHLFFFLTYFFKLRQKTVYVTNANKWDDAEQSGPTCVISHVKRGITRYEGLDKSRHFPRYVSVSDLDRNVLFPPLNRPRRGVARPFVQRACYFVTISIHTGICCPVGQG